MLRIDADAHVVETERTWDYLAPEDRKYRPVVVGQINGQGRREYWMIDGRIRGFRFRTLSEQQMVELSERTGRDVVTPQTAREMDDVELRLRDLDRLGIDVQVLYNTIFIEQLTERPEVDVALCRAWNRWLADIWKQSQGRLRWSMVPPLLSIPDALDEMRFAKQNGAVAVSIRPLEGRHLIVDPCFYPIYEEASRLDMAMGLHIANGNPELCDLLRSPYDASTGLALFRAPAVMACYSLIMSEIPQLFPNLRWGVIEASAQWIPWIVHEARERHVNRGRAFPENVFRDYRIFVTCQTNDDLPYVLKYAGGRNLLIGTDYGHLDPATEVDAITVLRSTTELPDDVIENILSTNPGECYAIDPTASSNLLSVPVNLPGR